MQDQTLVAALSKKVETLEKGLEALAGAHADDNKLKSTVAYLVRENQELKKELQARALQVAQQDKDLHKLLGRLAKLQQRQDESDCASPRGARLLDLVSEITQSAEYEALSEFKSSALSAMEQQTLAELRERSHQVFVEFLIAKGD